MGIDGITLLIDSGGSGTGFTRGFEVLLPSEVLSRELVPLGDILEMISNHLEDS